MKQTEIQRSVCKQFYYRASKSSQRCVRRCITHCTRIDSASSTSTNTCIRLCPREEKKNHSYCLSLPIPQFITTVRHTQIHILSLHWGTVGWSVLSFHQTYSVFMCPYLKPPRKRARIQTHHFYSRPSLRSIVKLLDILSKLARTLMCQTFCSHKEHIHTFLSLSMLRDTLFGLFIPENFSLPVVLT